MPGMLCAHPGCCPFSSFAQTTAPQLPLVPDLSAAALCLACRDKTVKLWVPDGPKAYTNITTYVRGPESCIAQGVPAWMHACLLAALQLLTQI